jgi:hypothetical protein
MNVRRLLSLLVLASVAVTARTALAVCTGTQDYRISPTGSTLLIVMNNFQRRFCPDAAGLLRQNLDTGAVVKITACSGTDAFIDECVPQGRYRYGLAMPYRCCETCCKTEYFAEWTVGSAPPANCDSTRMPGNALPAPYMGQVPWGNSSAICAFAPPDAAPRPSTPGSGGPRANLDAAPDPGAPTGTIPPRTSASGGCSVGGASGSAAVLILAGLVLALGFVRTAERRQRRP